MDDHPRSDERRNDDGGESEPDVSESEQSADQARVTDEGGGANEVVFAEEGAFADNLEIDDEAVLEEELSLDDLGAAYARVAAEQDPDAKDSDVTTDAADPIDADAVDDLETEASEETAAVVTPEAIVEAALFVGHPENKPLSEQRLASLMRGVTPDEVIELIERLNDSYQAEDQALRIIRDELGFRMTIAPAVEQTKRSFLGKVREARLSQMAIEVLSLVAYQPGITAQKVQDQRGRESNALLSQLVRRQLLRIERRQPDEGGRPVPHYYPTERFLHLFSLESLEDLPQVEEGLRE
ncbi:MAG: SMC-Scp complex subunit ScpB [Planctomycetota bacterium]